MRAPAEPTYDVRPANQATWRDLQAVFGERGDPARCLCQRYKLGHAGWTPYPREERAARLRDETGCDEPAADATSGLVAYLGDEPVGWCAVEPRARYPLLIAGRSPIVKLARALDPDDEGVWAITCFVTRAGFRHRGVSAALVRAAVEHARAGGARAVEGYPMQPHPGQEVTWGEMYVGARTAFADAGFREVAHPTPRRFLMRVDFR